MAREVLALSTTEFDRPFLTVDGEHYDMRAPDEVTVAMQMEIKEIVDAATASGEVDNPQLNDATLNKQVRVLMVDMPDEVVARLTPVQKLKILRAFFTLFGEETRIDLDASASQPSPARRGSTGAN